VLIPDILQTIRTYFQPSMKPKPALAVPTLDPGQWLSRLARLDELVDCREWEQAHAEIQQMRRALFGN
jgi:hypothetical protein